MGGSLKQIKDADDSPKEPNENMVPDVEELTANEAAIDISSDEDGSDTEPDDSNLNNLIDALVDDAPNDGIEKPVAQLPLADETSSDNGLKRTLLEDEDRFENVLKWFTGDDRSTIKDRDPLAIFAAAMVAATTVKALVTDQIWKEASLKNICAMTENEIFALVRLPVGKKAVRRQWVFTINDRPTGELAERRQIAQ